MRKRRIKKYSSVALSALLLGGTFLPNLGITAKAASIGSVVISEVYGGGGNSGATYKNDFIELYNPTDSDITIDGWSVQYAGSSATAAFTGNTKLTGVIKAHGYYLIQEAKGAGGTADLPTPEVIGTINMGGAAGKVALVKNITTITGKDDTNVIDYVAFGSTSPFDGSGPTPAPSNYKSVERKANDGTDPTTIGAGKGNGWDTNDNATDFVQADPNPQNSSTPIEPEIVIPPTPEEGVTLLKDVRANDSQGQPSLLNQTVTVEGTVTVANNIVGANTFYIQDATGGVNIFNSSQTVTVGSKVRVTGTVKFYRGLTEIEPSSIELKGDGDTITPIDFSITELNNSTTGEPKEGMLVKIRGKVTNVPATPSGGGTNVTLTDDSGKATTVRVMTTTGVDPVNLFKVNSYYDITGIVGQYDSTAPFDSGYQIFPRNVDDVTEYFALALTHTPMTTAYNGNDIKFVATAEGAETVTVFYKGTGDSAYQSLDMTKGDQNKYTAVLPSGSVPANGFAYYIKAVNKSETKTVGTADKPNAVQLVDDTFAPVLSGFQPADKSIVETQLPDISFLVNEPSGLEKSKLSIKLDGEEVSGTAIVTDEQVQLPLANELTIGTHTLAVEAWDTKGNHSNASWTFEVAKPFTGGNHYRGTTHNHTNISHDASGTPEEALKAGKAHGYDWFAFSDHSHDIDATLADKDTVTHNGMPERTGGDNWQLTKDLAKQYTKDGDYVVFPAFEMTSTTWGHSNVFGTDNFIDRKMNSGKYQDLNQYYAWVITYDNIAAQFNHPDMSANAFNNFMPYDQRVDKLFTMLEVGNGSGHYGYVNAEKKFFSALDLGWHVSPTYGEDNHDGTWGQTLNRTVIVSNDLTQNSLLHSMQNMRVYFEEDPNFTLDMLANGKYMGSTVDSKSLTFDIKGSDPVAESKTMAEYNFLPSTYQSDDRIKKVELITNGSKVVDSIEPMTKDFSWKPAVTVTGGQQWFVVKVTQMDGEEIYSAPIWTKEQDVDVRVSGLDVAGNAIVSGNPATLEAGVSNLGKTELTNLNVKFYYDQVNDSNLIGSTKIDKIASKGVGKASIIWNSPIAGDHKLIAVVDTPSGDSPEDNQFEKQVTIKQALGMTVMIDAAHQNENTSTDPGTYKNNFNAFTSLVQREGYTVVENKQPLTADLLKNVKVLVLTHPKVDLTASENAAVADFVKNGGSLFLTDKSNYNNNTDINNDLLQQMGATIQINNDGINDDTKEGNFWSDPLKTKFAVRIHLHPVSNYITDRADTLEYYSGSSLEKVWHQPLTDSDTVTILASGNETTYQGSVAAGYYVYDAISDNAGGSAIPAVASEKVGIGRIVVSGMNFMNDKQLDESFNAKGNDELALNAVNWLAHRETTVSNIADVRKMGDGNNVVVEGTVTTGAGVFFDAFYLQDATGGIMAFQEVPDGSLKAGDKVRVYGHIKTFENNKELEFTNFAKDVIKLGSGEPLQPKEVKTGEATADINKGFLVKVKGKVVSKFDENSYVINDGSGDVLVFTDGYIVNQHPEATVPVLKTGDTLEAVGLSGSFAQGDRIRVRDTRELVGTDTSVPDAPVVNPITDADTMIKGTAEAGTTVLVKNGDVELGHMVTDENGHFEMTIGKQAAGTVISVTATDAAGNTSEAVQLTVTDITAPDVPIVDDVTDADVMVTGTAESGSTVVATVNGKEIGHTTAIQDGKFIIPIAKQTAESIIEVTATDGSGNTSTAAQITVKDVTAPSAPILNTLTDADVVISGTAEAGSTVIALVNGKEIGHTTTSLQGQFTIFIAKQSVGTVVVVSATDKAGNVSSTSSVTVKDGTPPLAPSVDSVRKSDKVITGKAEVGSIVIAKVNGKEIGRTKADSKGQFEITIAKQDVNTKITVTATDAAGNESRATEVIVTKTPDKPAKPGKNNWMFDFWY
ncbi:Ig-like domain-containing protein [Neobacillus sp. LXY-1]|uniref:Ig-like domain-containing protein n=1 Tax=Neobacillus sp. LXY-1 TaxID=3379133 RepID=UPI003EDFFBF4